MNKKIEEADKAYRQGNPIMSDSDYDQMIEEFEREEGQRVPVLNHKVSRKQRIPITMASLNKVKTFEEFSKWVKSNKLEKELLVITPKYDGISLVVNEDTAECWTRGGGEEGQKSDEHLKKMLRGKGNLNMLFYDIKSAYSFGEAIMPRAKFVKYADRFANARNMVAGLFNRDVPAEELSSVVYVRYGLVVDEEPLNKIEQLNMLNTIADQRYKVPFKQVYF